MSHALGSIVAASSHDFPGSGHSDTLFSAPMTDPPSSTILGDGEQPRADIAPASQPRADVRLLCIGCNIFMYGLVSIVREFAGHTEVVWAHPHEHLDRINDGGAPFDLVFLSLDAPDFDRLADITEVAPELPVVVISPEERPGEVVDALSAGARGYIPMNSRVEVLRCAIPLILNGGFYLPASVFRRDGDGLAGSLRLRGQPYSAPESDHPPETPRPLTTRQAEVLALLAAGKSNKEIARDLRIIEGTIKLHVKAILRKMKARNRTEAVMVAARAGYLPQHLVRD